MNSLVIGGAEALPSTTERNDWPNQLSIKTKGGVYHSQPLQWILFFFLSLRLVVQNAF